MGGICKYGKPKYKSAGVEIVSMETERAILMESFHSYFRQLVKVYTQVVMVFGVSAGNHPVQHI